MSYIENLSAERAKLWEQLSHSCTILHARPFARMADRVLAIEKELALEFNKKRLQRAKLSERGSESSKPNKIL